MRQTIMLDEDMSSNFFLQKERRFIEQNYDRFLHQMNKRINNFAKRVGRKIHESFYISRFILPIKIKKTVKF